MAIAKITTLTPVHVGSGTTYNRNIDFVQEGGRIGIVDANKVAAQLSGDADNITKQDVQAWVADIESDKPDTLKFLREKRGKKSVTVDDISERIIIALEASAHVNTLKEQIRTFNEGAYLPGTSLKGAIRTAILNRLIVSVPFQARNHSVYREERKDRRTQEVYGADYKGVKLEKKYLGNDANHDIMRLLLIGDAHFGDTICLLAKTLNEKGNEHEIKESVTQFVECINQGEEALCQLNISDDLVRQIDLPRFSEVAQKMPNRSAVATWSIVFQHINAHTLKQINTEITRYEPLNLPDGTADFLEKMKDIKQLFNELSAEECIIRVGFGTGYLSMTGGWVLEQLKSVANFDYAKELEYLGKAIRKKGGYNGMALPKSRKIGYEGIPLGFIKIKLLSDEEIKNWKQQNELKRLGKKQEQVNAAKLALANIETARIRAEQEAKAARIAAEEAKKPKIFEGQISKNLEVDAEVIVSGRPNRVKIYVKGFEERQFEMTDSAQQPKGYVCRVALVVEKGKVLRVRHIKPK